MHLVTENEDVLVSVRNGVGILTLNRPKAINSLNDAMVAGIAEALHAWADDDAIHTVLLTGAGERGLCAGGDVVALYHSAREGGEAARKFWYDEYLLNAYIGRYPKPYVAVMDGIVMGGGVGVASHGNVRVATDTTKMAMPEVGIGFILDVGGTYLLSRAPGALGLHAALTGAPFSGADAIAMGFADHYVAHDKLADFTEAVVNDGVDNALATYATEPPASPLLEQRDWIDECYAGDTVADILAGGGYYSEILSGIVGPQGKVLLVNNPGYDGFGKKGYPERLTGNRLPNVQHIVGPSDALGMGENVLDGAVIVMSYHDLYWVNEKEGWTKIDAGQFLDQIARALKPGGVLLVVDHSAKEGTGSSAAQTLHRIDEQFAIADFRKHGLVWEAAMPYLRNPGDDRSKPVFDPSIRGKTDRFVHLYRKPG